MSYSLDSDIQEDLRTFPMYQRLRKINPYAYYSLNIQKQMQLDLRNIGSPGFFVLDPDNLPIPDEPTAMVTLPEALSMAEHLIDTGSVEFNDKAETVLGILYATDTVPIRRSVLHGDKHKVFAAMIALLNERSLQLEVDEYNTSELRTFGYSMSFMQFLTKAEAQFVLEVVLRTQHKAIYSISEGVLGSLQYGDN